MTDLFHGREVVSLVVLSVLSMVGIFVLWRFSYRFSFVMNKLKTEDRMI
jgi:hypothetical protein